MTQEDEVKRLRRMAAELVEDSERRDHPLSPGEDAAILKLLKEAEELERQIHSTRTIKKGFHGLGQEALAAAGAISGRKSLS